MSDPITCCDECGDEMCRHTADTIDRLTAALGDALDEIWRWRAERLRATALDAEDRIAVETLTVSQWLDGKRDALRGGDDE